MLYSYLHLCSYSHQQYILLNHLSLTVKELFDSTVSFSIIPIADCKTIDSLNLEKLLFTLVYHLDLFLLLTIIDN